MLTPPRHLSLPLWRTGEIFITWIKQLDKKMKRKKRKIALVINNCPAHPKILGLQSIELVFLPQNTTLKTQRMDQGIIQNLKVHYRKRVLVRYISAIDRKETPHISVLHALHMLIQACNSVTEKTISNCFRHADFTPSSPPEEDDDFDLDDDIPFSRLREHGLTPDVLQQFADADHELQTCAELTDEDILEEVRMNNLKSPKLHPLMKTTLMTDRPLYLPWTKFSELATLSAPIFRTVQTAATYS
nr:tigger transposable element-derived protein 4-like [Crassostrea gigas]